MKRYVDIRFLRQGCISAPAPQNFDDMTPVQKRDWADSVLHDLPDKALLIAMADYSNPDVNGYFDATPDVAALELKDVHERGDTPDEASKAMDPVVVLETVNWRIFNSEAGSELLEAQR